MSIPPAVDVVVPLYDKAHVIRRAVDSVRAQTFADWRLTVVDDGSRDDAAAALEPYAADERIRIVRQDNAGPGAARNAGLRLATAPLITFLDADDEWLPEFLASQTADLGAHPEAVAVSASWHHGALRPDAHALRLDRDLVGMWTWSPEVPFTQFRACVNLFHSSAVVARTALVERLGGFYDASNCRYGEDSYLWGRLLIENPVFFGGTQLLNFHTDASALSVGRSDPYPLPPALADVGGFLGGIEPTRGEWMRSYLAWYAAFVARRSVRERAFGQAVAVGRIAHESLGLTTAESVALVTDAFASVLQGRFSRSVGAESRFGRRGRVA